MENVLTLVVAKKGKLEKHVIKKIVDHLVKLKLKAEFHWLSENEACDIYFSGMDCGSVNTMIRNKFEGLDIDLAVQPIKNREKKLLIADMDSTIITTETLDELAGFLGLKKQISLITFQAMNGEIPFEKALRERVALLRGLSEDVIGETIANLEYTRGAKVLVNTMNRRGACTALVSGGFRQFTKKVKDHLGFSFEFGNRLGLRNGMFTGRVLGNLVTKSVKRQILLRLMSQLNLTPSDVLAVGDGANDLPMLKAAGMGVAYRAKPRVIKETQFRIDHVGLDGLLFFQGLLREEFVA